MEWGGETDIQGTDDDDDIVVRRGRGRRLRKEGDFDEVGNDQERLWYGK